MQGVSSFKEDFGRRLREQIPELQKVSIAFDADYLRNEHVQRNLIRLAGTLSQAGLQIEALGWEEREGKGLDDYLKNELTEHFYHIKGKERDSFQEEVLCKVGWNDNSRHTLMTSFHVEPSANQLEQGLDIIADSSGVSW